MAKECAKCGESLSFFQKVWSNLCTECQVKMAHQQAEAGAAEAKRRAIHERDAAAQRYATAVNGTASATDLERLAAEGYLIAGGRLIRCPVCGHDRFDQQRLLMNTRVATFFDMDWANSGADARICKSCTYVMWFARD